MTKTNIPEEIAHLDFNPQAEEKDEPVHECMVVHPSCTNVGDWRGTMRCCMVEFYSCTHHKDQGAKATWTCPRCKKVREDKWIKWRRA